MMPEKDDYDYAAWRCSRHVWLSVDAFLSAAVYADGIHSIDCGGLLLDLLLHGDPIGGAGYAVPVFFCGAIVARKAKNPPFFSGIGVAETLGVSAICVADPSLALNSTLSVAWYSGSAMQALQHVLAKVLAMIAARSGKELILIGPSGGGFAAIYYGFILGARASVLALNPQSDWLEYDSVAVRHYLTVAYPDLALPAENDSNFRQVAAAALEACGVVHSVLPIAKVATHGPRRLVYLQNVSDAHVVRHAMPFMDAIGCTDIGDGFHLSDRPEALLWFGNWGKGHAAVPKKLLENILRLLLDPDVRPAALPAKLRASEMAVYVDSLAAPRDLRQVVFDIHLDATTTGSILQASARVFPLLTDHRQLGYAFYVFSGEKRIATRWYTHDNVYIHTEVPESPATRVVVFVQDGFGHQLAFRETRAITKMVKQTMAQPPPTGNRIYVYGSCATRDAFEFAEHDFELVGYIARSSLASAFDPQVPPAEILAQTKKIESRFQRRMVEWDLSRSAKSLLRETPSDTVLLDLIDERFSLLDLDGALVTVSVEFTRAGYPVDPGQLVPSGSPRHLEAWKRGVDAFLSTQDAQHVIINRVRWASHDNEGRPLEGQNWIARNNMTLAKMYDHLDTISGIRFIDYPGELLVADSNHKWGVSPFHYIQAMYSHTMDTLASLSATSADEA